MQVALNAIGVVLDLLQTGHPVFATPPDGTERAMALYAALTQYMHAHELLVNAPAPAVALQQNLPPLDGFVDLVGLLDDVDEGLQHGPDVQEDEVADLGEPPQDDEILWHPQVGQVHQAVEEVGDGPAVFLQPVPLPEFEPVLQPALVVGQAPAIAVAAADGNGGLELAVNLPEPEGAPPPHAPGRGSGPAGVNNNDVEHVPEPAFAEDGGLAEGTMPLAVAGEREAEVPPVHLDIALRDAQAPAAAAPHSAGDSLVPGPSNTSATSEARIVLDASGRAALSYLFTQFSLPEDMGSINALLVEGTGYCMAAVAVVDSRCFYPAARHRSQQLEGLGTQEQPAPSPVDDASLTEQDTLKMSSSRHAAVFGSNTISQSSLGVGPVSSSSFHRTGTSTAHSRDVEGPDEQRTSSLGPMTSDGAAALSWLLARYSTPVDQSNPVDHALERGML